MDPHRTESAASFSSPSRRSFLTLAGAGVLGVAGGSALSGCSSSSSTGKAKVSGAHGPSQPLTTVLSGDPSGIDIVRYSDTTFLSWADLVYERLVRYDETRAIVPMLCSANPTVSEDLLTYTFPLRSGVTFHNGAKFTSADVAYTFKILSQPGSAWDLGPVDTVTTPDPRTVVVKLKQPFTFFLDFIALTPIISASVPYSPATYGAKMIGTGPYRFVSWTPNQAIVLERYKNYRSNSASSIPKITFNIVPNEDAQLSAFAGGSVQLIPSLSPKLVSLAKSRGATIQAPPYHLSNYWIACNFRPGRVTTNNNLRLAMAWAVDRKRIAQQIFAGYAHPESTVPGSASYYADPTLVNYFGGSPNLEKAKHYLSLAGGPPSSPLVFPVGNEDPNMVAAATLVQQDLQAIGIKSKIQLLGPATILTTLQGNDWDISGFQGNAESLAPDFPFFEFLPGQPANYIKVNDPQMTQAINSAFARPRGPQAAAGTKAIQQRFVELVPWILLVGANTISANSKKLVNYQASNFYDLWPLTTASVTA